VLWPSDVLFDKNNCIFLKENPIIRKPDLQNKIKVKAAIDILEKAGLSKVAELILLESKLRKW